jgi:hypothetical protein
MKQWDGNSQLEFTIIQESLLHVREKPANNLVLTQLYSPSAYARGGKLKKSVVLQLRETNTLHAHLHNWPGDTASSHCRSRITHAQLTLVEDIKPLLRFLCLKQSVAAEVIL